MDKNTDRVNVNLDQQYWTERYDNEEVGWDIGYVSPPLSTYIDQVEDKNLKILIPGAGNSYEAEYIWKAGFKNVYVIDISKPPLTNLADRVTDFPKDKLIHGDFFDLNEKFDLVLEQTFFCALHPQERVAYIKKMYSLLNPTGKLVGVLFNIPLFDDHPPFGGHVSDYKLLFSKFFKLEIIEECYNSIPQRAGNEVFIKAAPLKL